MLIKLAVLAVLLAGCTTAVSVPSPTPTPEVITKTIEVERVVEVEVIVEREVLVEVPVEVIVERFIVPPDCPASGDIEQLLSWLKEHRSSHQIWADFLANNEVSGLAGEAVGSSEEQLGYVARYNVMIGLVEKFHRVCP